MCLEISVLLVCISPENELYTPLIFQRQWKLKPQRLPVSRTVFELPKEDSSTAYAAMCYGDIHITSPAILREY